MSANVYKHGWVDRPQDAPETNVRRSNGIAGMWHLEYSEVINTGVRQSPVVVYHHIYINQTTGELYEKTVPQKVT